MNCRIAGHLSKPKVRAQIAGNKSETRENMEVQEARAPPSLWARPAPAGPAPIMKIAPRISRSDPTDGPGQYNIWSDKLSRSYSTLGHLRSCGNICRNYFQCGWPLAPNPQLWTCFWCVAKEAFLGVAKRNGRRGFSFHLELLLLPSFTSLPRG